MKPCGRRREICNTRLCDVTGHNTTRLRVAILRVSGPNDPMGAFPMGRRCCFGGVALYEQTYRYRAVRRELEGATAYANAPSHQRCDRCGQPW